MNRFTRRILTAGACAALVGGAVLGAAGSAPATPLTAGHHQTAARATGDLLTHSHRDTHDPRCQWVADQLALFGGGRVQRAHGGLDPRYFPWVSDQLVISDSHHRSGCPHHHHDTQHPGHAKAQH
jgi:hypothetical protein